jgi:N-hydroxyarylamine O-acetyltransferase
MTSFSLDQYFKRIHFRGVAKADLATVAELMRCQLMRVPFENLDVQAGKVVSLDLSDIVEKIVHNDRGGYCYEVNGLFSLALNALDIPHFFVAARPMTHGARKPKTHMAVIVLLNGEKWLCDCGYGGHGIRAPLRLSLLDTEVNQDGELFMLSLYSEQELVVKSKVADDWELLYTFDLTPQSWADFAPANHYNSTHPESIFVRKLLVVLCTPTGRKILFGHRMKIISNGQVEKQILIAENRAAILREEFGLIEPSRESLLVF